jgi:hypothetical protein
MSTGVRIFFRSCPAHVAKVFEKAGIPQKDHTRNGVDGPYGTADWKRSENRRRRTIRGEARSLGSRKICNEPPPEDRKKELL